LQSRLLFWRQARTANEKRKKEDVGGDGACHGVPQVLAQARTTLFI
jgi:hypothetical protein